MPYNQAWYNNLRSRHNLKNTDTCYCFDVGSAEGDEFLTLANNNNNICVYAFEPLPKQYEIIKNKTNHLSNFHIFNLAVSNYNGNSKFNMCDDINFRTSSLKQYDSNADNTWKNCWSGRFKNENITDIWKFVKQIDVSVIQITDFLKDNNIPIIHFLHCDTQGNDYEVIQYGIISNKILEGVVECCTFDNRPLYENQKSLNFLSTFLNNNNYVITKKVEQARDLTLNRGLETNLFFKLKN